MFCIISSVSIWIIEMFIAYIFFTKIERRKYSTLRTLLYGTALFLLGALSNYVFQNTVWINTIAFLAVHFLFAYFCYSIKTLKALFYSALLTTFTGTLEYATIFLISSIFQYDVDAYNTNINVLLIEGIISKSLYFFTCLIATRFAKKDKATSKFPLSFYIYPATTTLALTAFWYICVQNRILENEQLILAIVSLFLLAATVFLFITYQNNLEKENQHLLTKTELKKLQTEKNYYDILEHQHEQLMIYAHDTKNHLLTISKLNDDPQVEEYIRKVVNDLNVYSSISNSGNRILDIIINRYATECKMRNITFSYDVRLCNLSFVEDFDLVALLDNLLDNAIEAACDTKQSFVTLETNHRNSYSIIIISNSCEKAPVSRNDGFETTKKNKAIHGFGIKSIRNTLKKYSGDIQFDYSADKNLFIATVMLKEPS